MIWGNMVICASWESQAFPLTSVKYITVPKVGKGDGQQFSSNLHFCAHCLQRVTKAMLCAQ